jgi:hypothetical protein
LCIPYNAIKATKQAITITAITPGSNIKAGSTIFKSVVVVIVDVGVVIVVALVVKDDVTVDVAELVKDDVSVVVALLVKDDVGVDVYVDV